MFRILFGTSTLYNRRFHCSLYEVRDGVICYHYKDESPYEPIIFMLIGARRVWIKLSHHDWSSRCEVLLFGVK
jgi:hypothetical protein